MSTAEAPLAPEPQLAGRVEPEIDAIVSGRRGLAGGDDRDRAQIAESRDDRKPERAIIEDRRLKEPAGVGEAAEAPAALGDHQRGLKPGRDVQITRRAAIGSTVPVVAHGPVEVSTEPVDRQQTGRDGRQERHVGRERVVGFDPEHRCLSGVIGGQRGERERMHFEVGVGGMKAVGEGGGAHAGGRIGRAGVEQPAQVLVLHQVGGA